MDIVQGATIGSVQLDTAFETAARTRLEKADETLPMGVEEKELDDMAWEMAKSKEYQNAKCEYGSSDDDTEFFTVAIPRLPRGYVNEIEGINFGEMRFRRYSFSFFTPAEKLFSCSFRHFRETEVLIWK